MHGRGRRFIAASAVFIAAILGGVLVAPAALAKTPPTVSGCQPDSDFNPKLYPDQDGRWIGFYAKYRCSTPKEYRLIATVYQDPDGQEGTEVGAGNSGVHSGTSPSVIDSTPYCDSTAKHRFMISYIIEIGGRRVFYDTDVVSLACYIRA